MTPEDYIYSQIYKGALEAGASERSAKDHAVMGLEKWKNGKFDKSSQLISEMIAQAKRMKLK